jgi:hypothetical protein
MNAQALEHEGAMVEVYSKMKPDTFTSQFQTVLTAYYEDIKRVVRASTKSKVVNHKFEDLTCARRRRRCSSSRRRRRRRRCSQLRLPAGRGRSSHTGGEEPPLAPNPGGRSGGGKGRAGEGGKKAFGQA